jgi:acetylornithine deacetylase
VRARPIPIRNLFLQNPKNMPRLASVLGLLALPFAYAAPQAQTGMLNSAASSSPTASLDSLTPEETDALFQLHEDLVNIPSISDDEIECAEWLEGYLS